MSINRIFAGEVAMALMLAESVADRPGRTDSLVHRRSPRQRPKAKRGALRAFFRKFR